MEQKTNSFGELLHRFYFPHLPYPIVKSEAEEIENSKWIVTYGRKFIHRWIFLLCVSLILSNVVPRPLCYLFDLSYFAGIIILMRRFKEVGLARFFLATKGIKHEE